MAMNDLNEKIIARGREIFTEIAGEKPSLFDKSAWMGKVMEWAMHDPHFKETLFRFVDVFPSLSSRKALSEHVHEYFGACSGAHSLLSTGAKIAGLFGSVGDLVIEKTLSANIRQMGRQFIIGENTTEAVATVKRLRGEGFGAVVDVLGEATLSESEAEAYVSAYLKLMDALHGELKAANPLSMGREGLSEGEILDWGSAPKIQVAVKPTALYCLANPRDFEGSVSAIFERMSRLLEKAMEVGAFLCIDMESYQYKEITLEVYRRLRLKYPDYPYFGIVLQAYLKETDRDLTDLVAWAGKHNVPIAIRLVKGAYWDYEIVSAGQSGLEAPVWKNKSETDAAYERQANLILRNHKICYFACASHNVRTIAAVMEMANDLKVPETRYEFQLLYGMAEPIRRAILHIAHRVRLYSPYGELIPGMGYLVRRLIENTSNESFLRWSFAEGVDLDRLLENPAQKANDISVEGSGSRVKEDKENQHRADGSGDPPQFSNEPAVDFTQKEQREDFLNAIAAVRTQYGKKLPLFINGEERFTDTVLASTDPACPSAVLGLVSQASREDVDHGILAARNAFVSWRDTPADVRASYLIKAASEARKRIFELAAYQILEIGKQWDQAYGDVTEAIDFLEYYAREMIRSGTPTPIGHVPGEENQIFYEGRGVAAVIAPWNFPLAISVGMASAAIVTGNTVVFKPSSLTPLIGYQLVELFRAAGLPPGVFNYIAGRGSVVGDFLVDHPDVSLIAFTGSVETGLHIIERAAKLQVGQSNVKRVICEMGGKNAIIIDEDADLDEAVPHVARSAFGFQGQKCSACSRVIVLQGVYEKFVQRLIAFVSALPIGPAEEPGNFMGPVADEEAKKKILEYIKIAREEGTILYQSDVSEREGYYVPLTIVGDIHPEHRLGQEEIFGPVLSVMRVADIDQAFQWANATKYALTGGLFSRSPEHLRRAAREFRVGNLYLNRGITGSMVERQPFGGFKMSGAGTKAGGSDYLLHFMDPRVVTENTMRRGFVSTEGE